MQELDKTRPDRPYMYHPREKSAPKCSRLAVAEKKKTHALSYRAVVDLLRLRDAARPHLPRAMRVCGSGPRERVRAAVHATAVPVGGYG